MAKMPSQKQGSKSGGRLRRSAERPERTGWPTELPLANVIVLAASAGGHKALWEIVREIPQDIPAAMIIMQHMASRDAYGFQPFKFDAWLREATRARVVQIESGERLEAGAIYICPPGMAVFLKGRTLNLFPRDKVGPVSTINILFKSAATEFANRVIGVILTGFLQDGTAGLKAVHEAGGLTIVQDPVEAEYPDMPASAMKDLPVTFCLRLTDIGPTLDLLARRKTELETGLAVSVRTLKKRVALVTRLMHQAQANPETHQFLSTEMIALEADVGGIQAMLNKVVSETRTVSN